MPPAIADAVFSVWQVGVGVPLAFSRPFHCPLAFALPLTALSLPFPLPFPLPFHCLSTAFPLPFHCLFKRRPVTALSLPIGLCTAVPLPLHCLFNRGAAAWQLLDRRAPLPGEPAAAASEQDDDDDLPEAVAAVELICGVAMLRLDVQVCHGLQLPSLLRTPTAAVS